MPDCAKWSQTMEKRQQLVLRPKALGWQVLISNSLGFNHYCMGNLKICIQAKNKVQITAIARPEYHEELSSWRKYLIIGPKPCKGAIIGWQERFGVLIGVPECSASGMQIGGWGLEDRETVWDGQLFSRVGLSCPGMPCVAHAPHYRRERRSRVRRGRFDGRFQENHDSYFEIQGDSKRGFFMGHCTQASE